MRKEGFHAGGESLFTVEAESRHMLGDDVSVMFVCLKGCWRHLGSPPLLGDVSFQLLVIIEP